MVPTIDAEKAVRERYNQAAERKAEELCCPVSYNEKYLAALPQEIRERDYGCGDPSAYLNEGETVLDLGSGAGKICYIAAQIVGPRGRVIGIDMNEKMLALARKHQKSIGDRLGYHNVEFRRGKIQDLALDYDRRPLVPNESVDVVVSNCVLNLVRPEDKKPLFQEMFRVLKRGGRAVISDIVCDEPPTEAIKNDPELWSGCIAGAFQEQDFANAFEQTGFYGMAILKRESKPWRTIEGIEFRSMTLAAYKGKQGPCWETNKAVIYKGPWSEVRDDDHHTFVRGVPMAVCEKTFEIMMREPYRGQLEPVLPLAEIPLNEAKPFDCSRDAARDPKQTKGQDYRGTINPATSSDCCSPGSCC